ncbi:MAG: molybdate transport system ATP-binding protein [Candidatus Azotimanducaceae bacterium]
MRPIRFQQCEIRFSEVYALKDISLEIAPGEHWVLLGANGSGKSALAAALVGEGQLVSGAQSELPSAQLVSFEVQRAMIDSEREKDDSVITDEVYTGTPVREVLAGGNPDVSQSLIEAFGLGDKLDRGFRHLSTGETRKLMLIRAIAAEPELLVLDEPFDGLDADATAQLIDQLKRVARSTTIVLVLNRLDEIPDWVSRAALMVAGRISHQGRIEDELPIIRQLLQLQRDDLVIPASELADRVPILAPGPLVKLISGRVAYGDTTIFSNLDWQVNPGEHWQVVGPNGSGKTCLLNLITGDHPQCYVNDIQVVGYQRGQGESIWDLKQHMGYVSTALQWEYRVSISLQNIIISGFYDSIGLYAKATENQQAIAKQWLELLGLSDRAHQPFNQCSYGDQRLLLIARAMVKHPQLLILDEPCLGLDEVNRQLVLSLIEIICASSETTILYVNHHAGDRIKGLEKVLNMADYA